MNRALALLAANACTALAISSACFAADWSTSDFHLGPAGSPNTVKLSMKHQAGNQSGNWSQQIALPDLPGLSTAQLAAPSATPIRFTLTRPAGRFDCSGSARSSEGTGRCGFAADQAFSAMLVRRGLGRPNLEQSYNLAMSNFRPEVLDALAAAGYPRPTLDQSVALGIFAIDPAYVRDLASAGYRLGSVDELVGFKIHKVNPDLIRAYRALGYRQIDAHDLMAMAIHRVTPDFIRSFARIGYRNLPPNKLVKLRIFGVTPEDVRALQVQGVASPSAEQLVRRRLTGLEPRRRR
ncbi:MAG: hypothetical protein H0W65_08890 [Sphingomonas sp.]|uniref:hypothetical protein n=1 Tax=Sphingomonas sp. TaxID=28214 RepID=UPI0017A319A8|nr:hypothetical protein [Sphingomonas sp.]MBA3667824.1 hypothetical protein [Sphingomonas sp.]